MEKETTTKKESRPDFDSGYLEVHPRSAGNFGGIRISSIQYKDDRHLREMESEIKRHVDNESQIIFQYENWICGECKEYYGTKKEADSCCVDK